MMDGRIALCVDELTCCNPELIGLDGESLESQAWLDVFVSAEEARNAISGDSAIAEAWVASNDEVEPINLAATLKADRPELTVKLVEFNGCGSLYSRAHTASIDEVLERASFVRLYNDAKESFGGTVRQVRLERAPEQAEALDGTAMEAGRPAPTIGAPPGSAMLQATRAVVPAGALVQARMRPALAAASQPRGFVMPVVSGSGGAGKSTVAVMAAAIASRMGYRTLLLDYDLQFGDVAMLAGVERPLAIDAAMSRLDLLEEALRGGDNPTVLAAPMRLEEAEAVSHGVSQLLDSLVGAFDVIVANTGAAWADHHAALLERSSVSLFLIDQRASSLRACRHALELCARCGIATGSFQFAINRCRKGAPISPVDASCALQGVPVHELEDGGSEVEEYLGAGAVADLLDTGNPFCASLEKLLKQLLPDGGLRSVECLEEPPARRGPRWRGRRAGRKRG